MSCLACTSLTFYLLTSTGGASSEAAAHAMGYWPLGLAETARALLLTAGLFAGPLFEYFVADAGWRDWSRLGPIKELFSEWTAWRNIVAVSKAPRRPPPLLRSPRARLSGSRWCRARSRRRCSSALPPFP
jgi:hypothetical protein